MIKPNKQELEEIFDKELKSKEEIIECGKILQNQGAKNVLVSMAGEGAVLINENKKIFVSSAPKGKVINSVGAGDSMVAGFLTGYINTKDFQKAFYMGIAAGSASAFSYELAKQEEVEQIMQQWKCQNLR